MKKKQNQISKLIEELEKNLEKESKEKDEEIKKARLSGKKIKNNERYYDSMRDPGDCYDCIYLNEETDECKVNSNYDYLAFDREPCNLWESIYDLEDKK